MNLETFDNVLWDAYFPRILEQWTGPSAFDTEDDRLVKAALREKLLAATRDEIRAFLAECAKNERRAKYEALKQEFGDE